MLRQNTKFTLSPGNFGLFNLPPELKGRNGITPLPVIVDLTVGREMVLCWLEPTDFVHVLANLRPFQFFMHSGLFRSARGPLMWLLFSVPDPKSHASPLAMVECHLNPSDKNQVGIWRQLANQTHWHVSLIGAGERVFGFFEFENNFRLEEALDFMEEACAGIPVEDFMAAKEEFSATYSLEDLYRMKHDKNA